MRVVLIVGGMGAGKSTVRNALEDQGVPVVDLDKLGHDALRLDAVKGELAARFGADILDSSGEIVRSALAARAFASEGATRDLESMTVPRIREMCEEALVRLAAEGFAAAVVEHSTLRERTDPLVRMADVVVAVTSPLETRVARAVAAGFAEEDVRRRLARQIGDEERRALADVVLVNDGTRDELYVKAVRWWRAFEAQSGA